MKVEAITLREIHMPLVHFFETSFGRTTERRILLITVHCEGVDGWGECTAGEAPYYCEESIDTAWHVTERYLAPALLGRSLEKASACIPLLARVRGNAMAKAALESALWDVEAQQRGLPLWQLLGGTRREIPCGVSLGIQDSLEQLLDRIASELSAGYRRIKVKVKPGWDLDVLRHIRKRWPGILLSCDANSAYTLDDLPHLKKFDDLDLLMMEQPLWHDDLYFHAALQQQMRTAICLDESIHHARDAQAAIELGACRIINIKLGRVGGFTSAIAVHEMCRRHDVANWCGGMLEAGIGRSHNIALSTLPNFDLPGDVSASRRYWSEDIIDPEVLVSCDGLIHVPDTPGRGYSIRKNRIEKLTIRKETLRFSGLLV
jgi:O-succinylbenzoate synthase